MKRLPKGAIILIMIGVVIGAGTAYYLYNKPHQNIDKTTPDFIVEAGDLYDSFAKNDSLASVKYKDKIVEVTGTIDNINSPNDTSATILLSINNAPNGSIKCGMDAEYINRISGHTTGSEVKIRGILTGVNKLDELGIIMVDVELARCVIVE